MARAATGSIYESHGAWFAVLTIARKRVHFRLAEAESSDQADARRRILADIAKKLKAAKKLDLVEQVCREAGAVEERRLGLILRLVEGLVSGSERVSAARQDKIDPAISFEEFGRKWTSGELHKLYPTHVKEIDQTDNASRLARHVYPVVGTVRMSEFTVDDADAVLRQPTLPRGSLINIAALIHRICVLASYPGRLMKQSPLPKGWLPKPAPEKAKSFLYPSEDAKLLAATQVLLVRRLLFGFINREGCRKEEAARLEWSDLDLDHAGGGGSVNLDENKTDDARSWALDLGTAEALRRWKKIAPKSRWVFPAEALDRVRRRDRPVDVDHLAKKLREGLEVAGVTRPALFEHGAKRQRIRAHDLRATFITLSLANGRSESWVQDRTGHTSSVMINRYRRKARMAVELNLGPLLPLHTAIPELAVVEVDGAPAKAAAEPTADAEPDRKVVQVDFRRGREQGRPERRKAPEGATASQSSAESSAGLPKGVDSDPGGGRK
jgi:integrase